MKITDADPVVCKVYIPLQRKTTGVGVMRWSRTLTRLFRVTDTDMLVYKKPCGPNATPRLPNLNPSLPNATLQSTQCKPVEYTSRWVISRWHRIGDVDFTLFVSISFVLGSQRKRNFQWNMGLRHRQGLAV